MDPIGGRNLRDGRGRAPRGSGSRSAGRVSAPGRSASASSAASQAFHFNTLFVAALAVVVVLLVAIVLLAANRCSDQGSASATQVTQEQAQGAAGSAAAVVSESSTASDSGASDSSSQIDRAALLKVVDEDVADKLINRASSSEDARWIAQNVGEFAVDGQAVQEKLLTLAADEPAAQSYVRNFPGKYPMDTPESGKVTTVATGKGIPRLYQWDELWGYTVYSGTAFGLTGCCPTCLAMVYQGLTGNTDLSPYDMGVLAQEGGYATEEEGTYANFLVEEASALNLSVRTIDVTEDALKDALQSGQVVIANFAPGLFTEYGHFVVITGMNTDGTLVMNDPYSEERSNKSWDIDTIVEESQGFYAYDA